MNMKLVSSSVGTNLQCCDFPWYHFQGNPFMVTCGGGSDLDLDLDLENGLFYLWIVFTISMCPADSIPVKHPTVINASCNSYYIPACCLLLYTHCSHNFIAFLIPLTVVWFQLQGLDSNLDTSISWVRWDRYIAEYTLKEEYRILVRNNRYVILSSYFSVSYTICSRSAITANLLSFALHV